MGETDQDSMVLTGNYRRTMDEKLRVSIPKQLRESLTEKQLYIAPGTDRVLTIYTSKVLEQIGNLLSKTSPAAAEARAFGRLFYSQSHPAELDGQGRLRIPPELAKLSGLDAEVVIVGVRDRIELWDAGKWDAFLTATQSSYDELAERVFQDAHGQNSIR